MDHIGAIYGGAAGGGRMSLAQHIAAAVTQANGAPIVVQLVIYDLPDRDCAALASNGELSIAGGDTVIGPTGAKETLTGTGLQEYENDYITPIYQALAAAPSNVRFVLVVEDDSLPNIVTNTGYSFSIANCVAANGGESYPTYSMTGVYVQAIQYALNQFHSLPNVYNYLDIGHHGWLGWTEGAGLAFPFYASVVKGTTAQFASLDGIITNTANYGPTKEPFMTATESIGGTPVDNATFYSFNPEIDEADYAQEFYTGLTGVGFPSTIGFIIDTSRNGWGGPLRPTAASTSTVLNTFVDATKIDERDDMGQWCNQEGQGIGAFPTVNPGGATNLIAYVWVKPPGESDGDYPNGDTNAQHLALGATHGDENCDPAHDNTLANSMAVSSIPNSPPAGTFWLTEFLEDVQNAYPAIPVGSGFSLTATPANPVQGTTATSSVTVNEFGGFNGAVALSLSTTLPTGVTAVFSPTSVTGSSGSTLTFTVSASAVPGAYPLTVTGSGDGTTKTASLLLTVVPAPQFTITASSLTVSLPVGTNPTDTFTITYEGGLTGSVSMSATGQPSGMQINFAPSSVNSPGGNVVANFSAQSSTPAGSYQIKIVGTDGSVTSSVTITVTIPATGFTLASSPTTLSVAQGTSATDTITVTDLPGFTGTVSFNVSGLPSGVTSSFNPTSSATSTVLTLTASSTATTGAFTVTVTGNSGSNSATTSLTLNVTSTGSFTLKPSSTTLSVAAGSSGTDTITVTDVSPFTGSVTFAASGQPSGVTPTFSPASSTTSSVLTLAVGSTVAPGNYTITVTGTSGTSAPVTTTFTLTVPGAGSFTLKPSTTALTVAAGGSGTDTITVTDVSPFAGSVTFAASGQPSGVTPTFSPTSSTTSSVLTLAVGSAVAPGNYTITVTGTSGTLAPVTTTFTLTVPGAGSFTLKPSSTTLSVAPGASGTDTITVADVSPFAGSVTFAASGQPSGVTPTFSPASSTTSSVLTLAVGSTVAPGNYTITVTGTSGTLAPVTTTFTLTVTGTSPKCTVDYTISSQWPGGFGAAIAIVNNGSTALTNWTLTWSFANGQTITELWSGIETQSGANVTVTNEPYNGSIPAGGTLTGVGFNGSWNNVTNAIPTAISLNGTACTVN
jgi:cellulase/cellobiase CelA1